jgi:phage terminase large subunit-like protein
MTPYEKIAASWEEEILSGTRPSCIWTRKAVERQRADLLRQGSADFPYVWRPDDGGDVIDFIACLKHVKGECAGRSFVLSPWQVWLVLVLFSWKRIDDTHLRRYRRLFLECGKSSGKTALSSALLLYLLCADNEGGAEVVCAARATSQARQCFDSCRDMLRACPRLVESFGLKVLQHSIVQPSSASTLLPVSAQGKSLAGKILHGASVDELWAHYDRSVYEEMSLGCDKRNNSLLSSIGHAGENLLSVGYELHATAIKMLKGELKDEKTLALIFSAEGYDWKTDEAILAANPNAGVSSYFDTMREAQQRAVAIPSLQPAFKSHILCLWEEGETEKNWLELPQIAPCREPDLKMPDFRLWHVGEHLGIVQPDMLRPFVVGMQRTSLQERAAVVYCCKSYLDGVEHFHLFPTYFEPSANDDEQLAEAVFANFRNHLGYGVTINDETGLKVKALAHDSWLTPSPRLEKNGINTLPFVRGAKTFSPVMDFFTSLLPDEKLGRVSRIHFPEDDFLLSNLLGIHAHRDLNANLFPRRADPEKTIDAALACLYALRLAMAPAMLDAPEQSDVKMIFIDDDGTVRQNGPDGKLVTVHGPLPEQDGSAHPADKQQGLIL